MGDAQISADEHLYQLRKLAETERRAPSVGQRIQRLATHDSAKVELFVAK